MRSARRNLKNSQIHVKYFFGTTRGFYDKSVGRKIRHSGGDDSLEELLESIIRWVRRQARDEAQESRGVRHPNQCRLCALGVLGVSTECRARRRVPP